MMRFLSRPFLVLEAWFLRRTALLRHPRAARHAAVLVPLLFGLLSLGMGQDSNWDLQNYHWYNPHALLNGRLDVDMAPAQAQSYFNPTIDLLYYLLVMALPGPVVGFLMGVLHGLNFVLVLAIVRQLLGVDAAKGRLGVLLALAGVCGVGFLSELGNTMGDNLTSLFVLASLYLVLRHWQDLFAWSARSLGLLLLSGVLMGLGTGLKLTNAAYAVALCCAMLAMPGPFGRRIAAVVVHGCGLLAGLLASAGYWWLIMWKQFGNPLFPQFNQIFHSPWAQPMGALDAFHLPQTAWEALFWPFVFFVDFRRVGEITLKPAIMAALYGVALVFACAWLRERVAGARQAVPARLAPKARFLLVFGLVAYLAWMKQFSIYRYLVPLELLAPLMLWLLMTRIGAFERMGRAAGWLVALATLAAFPVMTWGHVGWAEKSFSAQFPPFVAPVSTLVFTAQGDPPMGWLATFVPPGVRVIALAGGFPESPAYIERLQATIASRPGPHYVMLASAKNEKEGGLQRKLALANALGMTADTDHCNRLDRILQRVRFQVQVKREADATHQCTLELQPQYRVDLAARDAAMLRQVQDNMRRYGLKIDEAGCRQYPAKIGAEAFPFRLCPVSHAE